MPVQIVVMYTGYTGDDVCTGDIGDDEADDDIIFVCVCVQVIQVMMRLMMT